MQYRQYAICNIWVNEWICISSYLSHVYSTNIQYNNINNFIPSNHPKWSHPQPLNNNPYLLQSLPPFNPHLHPFPLLLPQFITTAAHVKSVQNNNKLRHIKNIKIIFHCICKLYIKMISCIKINTKMIERKRNNMKEIRVWWTGR